MKHADIGWVRPLGISFALVVASAVLSACGGGDSTTAAATTTASAPAAAVVPAPATAAGSNSTTTLPASTTPAVAPPASPATTAATSPATTTATSPATTTACTQSNPKVGTIANLQTRSHAVSGQAKVLDDCTIEIVNFNYDGGGLPDVFVYGATAGAYASGFAIGPNLFGEVKTNATLILKLKDGDLDKLDGISIWCVRAAVSFGDGRFAPP